MKIYIPLIAIFISYHPQYYWINCGVKSVLDADTIEVLCGYRSKSKIQARRVRLVYIDAPELQQGQIAIDGTEFLKRELHNKEVEIRIVGRGYYGRLLGEVFFNGESLNLELVKRGYAFLYPWSQFLTVDQKKTYLKMRDISKKNQTGVWRENDKIQRPWHFRRMKKKKKKKR